VGLGLPVGRLGAWNMTRLRNTAIGAIGFLVGYMLVFGVAVSFLRALGHYRLEDAQIPIFPAIAAICAGVVVSVWARRRFGVRRS